MCSWLPRIWRLEKQFTSAKFDTGVCSYARFNVRRASRVTHILSAIKEFADSFSSSVRVEADDHVRSRFIIPRKFITSEKRVLEGGKRQGANLAPLIRTRRSFIRTSDICSSRVEIITRSTSVARLNVRHVVVFLVVRPTNFKNHRLYFICVSRIPRLSSGKLI